MKNIFKDSAAPYAFAIVISALGWLINSTVVELRELRLMEYTVEYSSDPNKNIAIVNIRNISVSKPIFEGHFRFTCVNRDKSGCFKLDGEGKPDALYESLTGSVMQSHIEPSVGNSILVAKAFLPPQSKVRYTFGTTLKNAKIGFLFQLPDSPGDKEIWRTIVRNGSTWEGWLISNYITILMFSMVVISALFFFWIISGLVGLVVSKRGSSDKSRAEKSNLKKGQSYEVVVNKK